MPLNKENDLHLTRLTMSAQIFSPPTPSAPGLVVGMAPALSPKDAASIYADLARYGFTSMQGVPGGVTLTSGDAISTLTLTGAGWLFQEDLSRSVYEVAIDKFSVAIRAFLTKLPANTFILNAQVNLEARWENLGEPADEHIEGRFLKPAARQLVSNISGLEYNGAGLRLNLFRHTTPDLPGGIQVGGGVGFPESFDVRVEPLFADKTKLYLQVTAAFAPTTELSKVIEGAGLVRTLLWEEVAGTIALEG